MEQKAKKIGKFNIIDMIAVILILAVVVFAGIKLMNYLIERHHTRIALISTGMHSSHEERNRAYMDVLKREGIHVRNEYICLDKHTMEAGYCAMKKLLCLDERPTAVFSTGYEFNLGIVMALNEEHVKYPE